MAEFVEQRMEEMVSVLEKIKQTTLINEPDLKKIIAEIREHEMKIQRPARTMEDFFEYLNFLKTVLDTLKVNREEMNYHHHTNEIEDRIKAIIASRFGMANHNFKHDLRFWHFRLRFMKDLNCVGHISNLFTEATKVLGSKYPELWIDASRYEWTKYSGTSKGIELARQYVQLGLRRHSDCLDLFVQGFLLELYYVEFVRENQQEKEKVLELENGQKIVNDLILAKSFYKQAQKMCQKEGIRLYQVFYSKATKFTFTTEICRQILEDLQTEYPVDENTYDILAKIVLAEGNGKLYKTHIDKCMEKYEEGLKVRPTVKMYDLYIQTLSHIVDHIPPPSKYFYEGKLLAILERAHDRWKLSEQNYVKWFELLRCIENEGRKSETSSALSANDILEIGYTKFPYNSQILHEKILQDLMDTTEDDDGAADISKVVYKYEKNLRQSKGDTSSIWLGLFINLTLQSDVNPAQCEKIFRDAPPIVKGKLAILFIKYFGCVDMSIARQFYDQHFTERNLTVEFHLEMGKLEATTLSDHENQETILARISQCYENATQLYGQENIESWLTYIAFERERGNATKASTIYNRALVRLPMDLKEQFILAERNVTE